MRPTAKDGQLGPFNQWLAEATIVDLPPEASADTMVRERIEYVIKNLARGETASDADRGRLIGTSEGLAFRTRPVLHIFNSAEQKNQISAHDFCRHLRSMGYRSKTIRLPGSDSPIRVWVTASA